MAITKTFVLGGKAIFTIEPAQAFLDVTPDAKPHYTYRVNIKEANDKWPEAVFVALLTGPDNTSDYTYLGMLVRETGGVRLTGASKFAEGSVPVAIIRRVLARVWADDVATVEANGWKVHHEGRCGVCGKPLTVPESVEDGIGPVCREKVGLPSLLRNGLAIYDEDKPKKARKPRKSKKVVAEEAHDYMMVQGSAAGTAAPDSVLGPSFLDQPSFMDEDR